ncbi:HigA family addiction module antitoxin [Nemorincola caseinilytica]|uniref:HigA family addiction module antitoxin n=1 Tax=Nemorincola caseinilytica TaxID=2054315 RepID=A0ABP8NEH3_9BACT
MNRLRNIHPGEVLKEEFLQELNISAYRLAKDTNIPQTRISEIIKGSRRITADTALRLAKYFGTTPKFWLGLQDDFDLEEEKTALKAELDHIKRYTADAA